MAAVLKRRRKNVATLNVAQRKGRVQSIRRRIKVTSRDCEVEDSLNDPSEPDRGVDVLQMAELDPDPDPEFADVDSQYARRKIKAAESWGKLRKAALHAVVEDKCLPSQTRCVHCKDAAAEIRCVQCGPSVFLCQPCTLSIHKYMFSHTPEIWKDDLFCEFKMHSLPPVAIPGHNCECGVSRKVMLFHLEGPPKYVDVQFCSCEEDAITLIRLQYWPATPVRPSTAFSFQLLDWIEALLLECQVSLHDISAAVQFLMSKKVACEGSQQVMYPCIIDAFEEYRFMKNSVKSTEWALQGGIREVISCPACPKESGKLIMSMDALFGLCRKKAAGKSVEPPLYNDLFFQAEDKVREHIQSYQTSSSSSNLGKECSNFLAGNALRSQKRFKALDETGIMGVACRHEFPHIFINLYHGERIGYAVFLMETLKSKYPNHQIHLLYDVACTLERHLQSTQQHELLHFFSDFSVPIFHCFGHKASCQVKYNPRYEEGLGLTDGEVMERLWSKMRRFSRMSKEMRPSHRIDVLTDALRYCADRAAENLVILLPKRLNRALKVVQDCKTKLESLFESSPVSFDVNDIKQWISQEKENLLHEATPCSPDWKEEYLKLLQAFSNIRSCFERSPNAATSSVMATKLVQMEEKLQQTEVLHGILQRWEPNSTQYKDAEQAVKDKEKANLKSKIMHCSRERWFLLTIKAKYADGHALASRLSKRITVVTAQLKALIKEHNSKALASHDELSWASVTDLNAMSTTAGVYQSHPTIPDAVKKEACDAQLLLDRAEEEIVMLKEEMRNTFSHYIKEHEDLSHAIQSASVTTQFQRGTLALLHKSRFDCEKHLNSLTRAFSTRCDLQQQLPQPNYAHITSLDAFDQQYSEASCSVRQILVDPVQLLSDNEEDEEEEFEEDDYTITLSMTPHESSTGNTSLTSVCEATALLIPLPFAQSYQDNIITATSSSTINHFVRESTITVPSPHPSSLSSCSLVSESLSPSIPPSQPSVPLSVPVLSSSQHQSQSSSSQSSPIAPNTIPSQCSESEDEEMISEDWRIGRFEREQFLRQQTPQPILSEEELNLLSKTDVAQPVLEPRKFSYLQLSKQRLAAIDENARRSERRMRALSMLSKGPYFVPTSKRNKSST